MCSYLGQCVVYVWVSGIRVISLIVMGLGLKIYLFWAWVFPWYKAFIKTDVLVQKSLSLSSHNLVSILANAVYYYSLPLLRSCWLLTVHLQLDRQHRSIQVGHVL